MSLFRNATEEFSEEILYGTYYAYIMPEVRAWVEQQFPDTQVNGKTQPNILKEAVESSINVLLMGALFMLMRYQEAFLERLFALSRAGSLAILTGGKGAYDRLKNKIKGKRGVRAASRYAKVGDTMQTRAMLAQHVQSQADTIINARNSQYNSSSIYSPAAEVHSSGVHKERLYREVGDSKVNAKLQLAMFKLQSGTFSEADKETLKIIFKSANPGVAYDPSKIDIEHLNKISHYMFTVDSNGKIIGLTESILHLLNGLGYLHKSNSGSN